jgi:ribokinase
VGRDVFGPELVDNLVREGIDVNHVACDDEATTGAAFVAVSPSGENSILSALGANLRCSRRQVDAARDAIAGADCLLVQLGVPLETVDRAVELAREVGTLVVLDPTPIRGEIPSRLHEAAVLTPNESEATHLTGIGVSDEGTAARAGRALRERGVATVVVKLGAAGCVIVDDAGERLVAGFEVTPVDTTGAGDAFAAGLATAWASGQSIDAAARYGNAVGALACTVLGAQSGLPRRQAVEAFLAQRG